MSPNNGKATTKLLTIEDHGFSIARDLAEIARYAEHENAYLLLDDFGKPVAVMMGIAEYEEMGGRCEGGVITTKEQLAQIVKNLEE